MTAPGDLYRCSGCGLVAMEPMPTRAELPGLYPAEYENFSGPGNPIARFLYWHMNFHTEHHMFAAVS